MAKLWPCRFSGHLLPAIRDGLGLNRPTSTFVVHSILRWEWVPCPWTSTTVDKTWFQWCASPWDWFHASLCQNWRACTHFRLSIEMSSCTRHAATWSKRVHQLRSGVILLAVWRTMTPGTWRISFYREVPTCTRVFLSLLGQLTGKWSFSVLDNPGTLSKKALLGLEGLQAADETKGWIVALEITEMQLSSKIRLLKNNKSEPTNEKRHIAHQIVVPKFDI